MPQIEYEIVKMVSDAAERLGVRIDTTTTGLREYTASRMMHLSGIIHETGYQEAVRGEAVNLLLEAAGEAVESADAFDAELIGFAGGALALGARLVAGRPG